jgi:hypothetical protein
MMSTPFDRVHDVVQAHSQKLEPTTLVPHSFFVAWNGVLCLVFEGFPPGLVALKQALNNECTSLGIKSEAFGSKWPKVTLGYPKQQEEEQAIIATTTLPDLIQLKTLCQQFDTTNYPPVGIQTLSVVHYAQRSLEQLHERRDILLLPPPPSNNLPCSPEETNRVESVLSEWKDCSCYLERVNVPLDAPYRDGSPEGHTCVAFLNLPKNSPLLLQRIRAFRNAVDETFPDRFVWMEDSSLHCTIRALDKIISCG